MADYIERQAAIIQLSHNKSRGDDEWELAVASDMEIIRTLPSADIVQVCRCANCIHHAYDEIFSCYWCEHPGMAGEVKPDFYCAYGEREE